MAGENYARIVRSFWTDPDIRRLLRAGQHQDVLLLLYFVTSPHSTMIGLYFCPLTYAATETGLPIEVVEAALAGPLARFVAYDAATEEVFVRRAAYHQMGDLHGGDKRKEHVRRFLAGIHSAALRRAFLTEYAGWHLDLPLPEPPSAGPETTSVGTLEGYSTEGHREPHVEGHKKAHLELHKGHSKGDKKGSPKAHAKGQGKDLFDQPEARADTEAEAETETVTPGAADAAREVSGNGKAPPTSTGNWPAEWAAVYSTIGLLDIGKLGKLVKPVREKYGGALADRMWADYVAVRPHLEFGELNPKRYDVRGMGPEDFVKTAGYWAKRQEPVNAGAPR
jgi:hypothetical protein